MKAFLSHSSHDKEFVRAVAKELGRQFCVVDEQVFRTGDEFKGSIERGLDESSAFVLFASQNALSSIWVDFETEEAWIRRLRKTLTESLVYLIDSAVKLEDLPEWLRRALIRRENSPKPVARDIRSHLDDLLRQKQHLHFVGRANDVEELERVLTPFDGSTPPHVFFVTGLPGIGRRSLVRQTSPTILNLKKCVGIPLGEGDSIHDICVRVANRVEPYSTSEGLERIVREIRGLSDSEATDRTLKNLRIMANARELPIFMDEEGLLDSEGYLREPIKAILGKLAPNDEAYIAFISARKPQKTLGLSVPLVKVDPLKAEKTKRLISLLANEAVLRISPGEVAELAEYIAGYPPAAYFAIQQAKDYGLPLVLQDKARLVQFRSSVFLRHLSTLQIGENEQALLRLLAVYSPLPLPIIAKVISLEIRKLNDVITHLIDLALVVTNEDGYYCIADPVAHAVLTAYGFPSKEEHKKLARELSEYLKRPEIDTPLLELSRVLFRAARWAKNDVIAERAIHLSNDLIRLTETSYHAARDDYENTIAFGYAALEERPDSITARNYLIRALIQEEKWNEAADQIEEFKKHAPLRELYFLVGFLKRKQGYISEAISAYRESLRHGRKGAAINRELGLCYYLNGDLDQAMHHVKEALERNNDNPYLVDLWAQIATRQGDENTARMALRRLEVIDNPLFYNHRLSRIELAFGSVSESLAAARRAVERESSPPFAILANCAYCETEYGELNKAEELLGALDRRFGRILRDIRMGLKCRIEIAREHYNDALAYSEQIKDQSTFFYKKIRLDALAGELRTSALKDETRAAYEEESSRLKRELRDVSERLFIPSELDSRS